MNNGELIKAVGEVTGVADKDVGKVLRCFAELVGNVMRDGGSVVVSKLGRFARHGSAARMGRNPRTGTPIRIKAKMKAVLIFGKSMNEKLN